ncbi:ETS-related transcription factor Elf-5-like [Panulirus ornatus]|uniref:ETS-related transcription factor Elf-5-like n=1 Tax=Panulirus ornatus TaxID=150431 RepID=UPI003A89B980
MANMTPNEIFQFPEKQNHLYYFSPLYGITDEACFPALSAMSQEQPRREAESHSDEMANFLLLPMNNWTNVDCTEWVASVCSRHNIDQSTNSFWTLENCTGQQLLTLSHSDMCQCVGTRYGNTFYEELQRMKNREGTATGWSMSGDGGSGGGIGEGGGSGDAGGTSQWKFALPPWMPEDPTWTRTLEDDNFPDLTINFDTINIERGPKVWEFLVRLLENPSSNPSLVMWEEESEGTFRLINHELITRIWGRRSGNPNLSYTNFARSLRHHYKSRNLVSVRERQLVYGLGNSALRYLNDLRSGRTSR